MGTGSAIALLVVILTLIPVGVDDHCLAKDPKPGPCYETLFDGRPQPWDCVMCLLSGHIVESMLASGWGR